METKVKNFNFIEILTYINSLHLVGFSIYYISTSEILFPSQH